MRPLLPSYPGRNSLAHLDFFSVGRRGLTGRQHEVMSKRETRTFIISLTLVLPCAAVTRTPINASIGGFIPKVSVVAASQKPIQEPATVPPHRTPPANTEVIPTARASALEVSLVHSPLAVAKTDGQLGWLASEPKYKTAQGTPRRHLGVDFKARYREPVYAMADGEVVYRRTDVTNFGGDGMPGGAVVIKHRLPEGKTFYALYGHLEQPTRAEKVAAGQVIGRIGHYYLVSSGQLLDKPCLHIGVFVGQAPPSNPFLAFIDPAAPHSRWVDPLTLISGAKRE